MRRKFGNTNLLQSFAVVGVLVHYEYWALIFSLGAYFSSFVGDRSVAGVIPPSSPAQKARLIAPDSQ